MSFFSIYKNQVRENTLTHDAAQEEAARKLDDFEHYFHARLREEKISCWPCLFCCLARMAMLRFQKDKNKKGLYLYGPVGRGKTHLMDLFYDSMKMEEKRRIHFHEFMKQVHEYLHHRRRDGMDMNDAIVSFCVQTAERVRLLCFDEFHVSDIADAMILSRLFTGLFERGVYVVMTSNAAPDELYPNGIQRERFIPFIDHLKEKLVVHEVSDGTDYRLERLKGRRVYFTPITLQTPKDMDDLYNDLTAHSTEESFVLSVKGHSLSVPRAAGSVARFNFKALCEKAYGAEDYLALAKEFEYIFIDNMPVIDSDNTDVARRLIVMVDTFYEKKVKMIVSAEAVPEKLYPKGVLKKEFERTASRLYEMQSYDYLGKKALKD